MNKNGHASMVGLSQHSVQVTSHEMSTGQGLLQFGIFIEKAVNKNYLLKRAAETNAEVMCRKFAQKGNNKLEENKSIDVNRYLAKWSDG